MLRRIRTADSGGLAAVAVTAPAILSYHRTERFIFAILRGAKGSRHAPEHRFELVRIDAVGPHERPNDGVGQYFRDGRFATAPVHVISLLEDFCRRPYSAAIPTGK
jgi:hypothetical protein